MEGGAVITHFWAPGLWLEGGEASGGEGEAF